MSKGSKRHSAKYNEALFKYIFKPLVENKPFVVQRPWLEMTDEQIDREYMGMGKADRTRLKKERDKETLRLIAQEAIKE